jgi:dihydrofolate reductase
MGKYESDIVDTADTLMLGRVTYDSFAGAWPARAEDPAGDPAEKDYARRLNAMRKVVFTKTLQSADWAGSEIMRDVDAEAIKRLKAEDGKDILIYGSANAVKQLTQLGLIDEYQLLVHPVVLGGGKSPFAGIEGSRTLKLESAKPFSSGVVLMTYTLA